MSLTNQDYDRFNHLRSYRNIEEKEGKKKGKKLERYLSHQDFFGKFSANNFTLSDTEDNTSGLLNRVGIVDLLLFRTLLLIRQKCQEPSFWEIMDSLLC